MIDICYTDEKLVVCIKPAGVLSTDEEGGLPELVRAQLNLGRELKTVHRLDRAVSGLIVLAKGHKTASKLTEQVMSRSFEKEYLAVIHGRPEEKRGTLVDLLGRDKARKMTYVAKEPAKGVQEAVLDYEVLSEREDMSLVRVVLHTGRTHQIRVQFASRGMPLVGERKYSTIEDGCPIALWSHLIRLNHPVTGERMEFKAFPLETKPWNLFTECNIP